MISSTVGLEALLYEKPVLTLGQPFYSGYGITLDVDSFREIRAKVPELLRFRPTPRRSAASSTPRCAAAFRARPSSSTARTRTRCGSPARSRRPRRRRSPSGSRRARDRSLLGHRRDAADDGARRRVLARGGARGGERRAHEPPGDGDCGHDRLLDRRGGARARRPRHGRGDGAALPPDPRRAAGGVPPQARGRSAAGRARGAGGSGRPRRRRQPAPHRATRRPARTRSSPTTGSPASSASAAPSPSARASGPRSPAARSRSRTAPTRS